MTPRAWTALTQLPLTSCRASDSNTALVVSSIYSGTPSVFSTICWSTSSGRRVPPATDRKFKRLFRPSDPATRLRRRPRLVRGARGVPSPPRRAARHRAAMRGLDRRCRRGADGNAAVCWCEALGSAGLQKLGGGDCKRHCTARRGELHRCGAHVAYGPQNLRQNRLQGLGSQGAGENAF